MTDTYSHVKSNLVAILRDADYRVIALSGKWGTGKTYLWRAVKTELFGKNNSNKQPIYVSLFGAKTINDLKLRILQNAYLTDASTVRNLMKTGGGIAKELLKKFTGYSAEEAALLWLPNLVAGRLIVIDDVERKHKSLDIDEFLGLIDEYSENHNARFLILLNTDKLIDADGMWATLHEKVIDVEVVLNPSPSESFDIAANGKPCPHMPEIRAAIVALKVNNIRIIERVMRTIHRIAEASGIDDVPASRWIPSTVLLTSSHYRAVENAPPFSYIISFNSFAGMFGKEDEQRDPQELEWDTLLKKLGIRLADAYENMLQEYLASGLLDVEQLKLLFAQYKKDALHSVASGQRDEFFTALWWDPHKSKSDLLDMARGLLATVDIMDPGAITDVISAVEEVGDNALAQVFLDKWIQSALTRPEYQQLEERIFESSHRKFNAKVVATLNQMRDMQHPPLTVVEATERIIKNSGWGEREKIALARSTVQEYESSLRQIKNDELARFLLEHLEWIRNGPYDDNFKTGVDNFIAACAGISTSDPDSRLARIIHRAFQSKGLADKLSNFAAPMPSITPP
ncbi:MAG: P-loop NTPase fold protein [Georgfuchsia sp.]